MATYKIIGGPSKLDLMLATFDQPAHPTVTFRLEPTIEAYDMTVRVVTAGPEDGSGESWNIAGIATFSDPNLARDTLARYQDVHKEVTIYFSTQTRTGTAKTTC